MPNERAIEATVTGHDQEVGFRALVMKQAIEYNLGGSAKNEPNHIVQFTLQGHEKRVDLALERIRQGTEKSGPLEVTTKPVEVYPTLRTFTIFGWTSSSRHIETPYDLIYKLRPDDETISEHDAKKDWREVLEKTLGPEDLKKLRPDD
jgi:acylphosphatase